MTSAIRVNAPPRSWELPPLREIWDHRDVIYYLGRRDIAVRYKQTAIGVLWVVLQPLLLAAIFSVFLGIVARIPRSADVPYPVFALVGMTMWLYFTTALSRCSESTTASVELISKVYFPRLVIPLASLIQPAVDFVVASVVLVIVMIAYGVYPGIHLLLLPVLFLLAAATALGIGLWLSAFIVRFRDVKQIIPFFIQTLLFATPVLYGLDLVPERYRLLYALNPLVAVLEGWRWALLPGAASPGFLLLVPVATSLVLVISGLMYFQRAESSFADLI